MVKFGVAKDKGFGLSKLFQGLITSSQGRPKTTKSCGLTMRLDEILQYPQHGFVISHYILTVHLRSCPYVPISSLNNCRIANMHVPQLESCKGSI